jgi:hypothetical protein
MGGREPVREIDGVPFGMIDYFSRRRAAIEKRYAQLVRDYRDRHGHDPSSGAAHELARQANLDTRQAKKPPRSLASKRAAWRAELDDHFGPGAAARLMTAIPDGPRQASPESPAEPLDLDHFAERAVAGVAARRSVWTSWNIRAEAERLLRAEAASLPPGKHRQTVDAITALAISPKYSVSVDAPALLDEPPELRRDDGESVFNEHGAARYTSPAVLDAEQRLLNATRRPAGTVRGGVAGRLRGHHRHPPGRRAAPPGHRVRLRRAAPARRARPLRVRQDDRDARLGPRRAAAWKEAGAPGDLGGSGRRARA